jgi:ABC-2 type transport system permease protein
MNAILLIARRELGNYFKTWIGYIIIAAALLLEGLCFNGIALGGGPDHRSSEVLSTYFFWSSGINAAAALFISMRLLAAEREQGTVNLLYSSPVRDYEIVLGKFLSGVGFLLVLLVASLYMPLMVLVAGKISFGHVFVGYLGMFLFATAALAIGTFGSALTKSQILSVIVSALITLSLVLMWFVGRITERPLSQVFENLALWSLHFPPFQSGVIHVRDVVYYLAVTYVSLFAATRVLEARRWR